ncbi:extracellular solute-binding protein [Bifidobacterium miconisargentati]|uniref:extracellular solute-binding protein n=1 Tax=Bifidobacterium miconisargentati TaxID=2834437 RepID=UPI001BDD76C7|nr:extracellular solute-binding protein [Bifidobacterium miconisargentati]MBW3089855.1 extracellular solute-binding protein [Bifidobacterium miconisargentati]
MTRTTIYDIAREVGVSASTVSRALSGSHRVSPKTEFRIRRIAQRMGYYEREDHAAEPRPELPRPGIGSDGDARTNGDDNVIAIVVPNVTNPFYAHLTESLCARFARQGYGTGIIVTSGEPFGERRALRQAMRTCIGAVLVSVQLNERDIRSFALSRPVVLVNRNIPGLPSATLDEEQAIDDALTRLKADGHASVCFLAGPTGSWSSERRRRLIRSLAYAHDMGYRIIRGLPATIDGGLRAAAAFGDAPTDAVIAFNDRMALGFIAGVRNAGMRVPEDVVVVGFDDLVDDIACSPTLSSIGADIDAMAGDVADAMTARLRSPESSEVPCGTTVARFVARESVAARRRPLMRRSPYTEPQRHDGTVTLTMLSANFNEIMPRIEEFERTHPGILIDPIEGRTQKATTEFYWNRHVQGQPIPDLFNVEYSTMPLFAASSCLLDLTEPARERGWESLFSPPAWQAAHYAGRLYGVPGDQSQTVMFYREDLLRRYGLEVPRTWEQWAEDGAALHRRNHGRAMGLLDTNSVQHLMAMLRMMGARPWIVDDAGRITVCPDDPAGGAALDFLRRCLDSGALAASPIAGIPTLTAEDGSFLTLVHANWMGKILAASYPRDRGLWKVALPPANAENDQPLTAEIGGSMLTISASIPAGKRQAALDFVSWFNTAPASIDLRAGGGFSATRYFQDKPSGAAEPDPFFGQDINAVYAQSARLVNRRWSVLPFDAHMESTFASMVVPSLVAGGDLPAAFRAWLLDLARYAAGQGFQVRVES